jgi:hypothetical protein
MVQFDKRSELSSGRKSQSSIVSFSYTALVIMYFEESTEFGSRRDPLNSLDRLCSSIFSPNLQVNLGGRQQSAGHVSTVGQIIPATIRRLEDEGDRSTRAKARFYKFRLEGHFVERSTMWSCCKSKCYFYREEEQKRNKKNIIINAGVEELRSTAISWK